MLPAVSLSAAPGAWRGLIGRRVHTFDHTSWAPEVPMMRPGDLGALHTVRLGDVCELAWLGSLGWHQHRTWPSVHTVQHMPHNANRP